MRLLVCGGRDFNDPLLLTRTLDRWAKCEIIDCVIEGNARGADRMAGFWARKNGIMNLKFTPDWKTHGKTAGVLRNQQMLTEGRPDVVLAFPGGRGTEDMIRRTEAAGIAVCRILSP